MVFLSRKKNRQIKRLILIITVVSILSILGVYFKKRAQKNVNEPVITASEVKADLELNKVRHKATKEGIQQWDLTAKKASYFQDRKQIIFDQIHVTFFLENGKKLNLTADSGILNTETNDIEIKGNIVAIMENRIMKTEELHYLYNQHIIKSNLPIAINAQELSISANGMFLDLKTEQIRFDGNVHGILNQAINL